MATRERRKDALEFKSEAAKLAEQPGRSLAAVARELGIERSVRKAWLDSFIAGRYEKQRSLRRPRSKWRMSSCGENWRRSGWSETSKTALCYFAKLST